MEKLTMEFEVLETDTEELKIMYFLSQAMDLELLDDEEQRRVVWWFNEKYMEDK